MLPFRLFALGASQPLGLALAALLDAELDAIEERDFEDGEHKLRPLAPVQGADAYVLHSLHSDRTRSADEKLCRLLFFLATLKDHGAARVTALVPYLCYARKDRRTKPLDPLSSRYVAMLLEAVGMDRLLTLDVHNPAAFENAFRRPVHLIEACDLFARHLAPSLAGAEVVVVSPDPGGVRRAEALRVALAERLETPVGIGMMEKRRSLGQVSGETLFAEVAGRTVVIVDDLIGTGTTLLRAATAAREAGAVAVHAVATHGLFLGAAPDVLSEPALDRILVTDSVPPFRLRGTAAEDKVEVLPCAPLLADAVRALHASALGRRFDGPTAA